MPRQARLDFPGTLHHAICRGIEKREIVSDTQDRDNFVKRLGQVASETETIIYAWSLMTNHAHILLRSGPHGISKFMRKLLTGYAISYNRRHGRHGYLFQNRYKSIVCEEEPYFLELVRYIHLNPIRAGLVETLNDLDRYPYSGHSVLMGNIKQQWQDHDYVLKRFDSKEGEAKREYRKYVEAGIRQGRCPELVGGGLIRSQGGWSEVPSMRRQGKVDLSDERILGSGKFVEKMIEEAEERQKSQFTVLEHMKIVSDVIRSTCLKEGTSPSELKGGSRRRHISQVRQQIAHVLVEEHGIAMATVAREVGVTTAAISRMLKASLAKID